MSTQLTPDAAELAGRLQTMTQRAELAEAELAKAKAVLRDQIAQRVEMMSQLVAHRLPIARRVPFGEPLRIESQIGQLRIVAPDGLVVFENGPALERVIMQLIDQAREAFPETFTEVF